MKISRLQHILTKAEEVFPDIEVEFRDGYIALILDKEPTQEQIDAVPTAEYDEYMATEKIIYRDLKIWGD